MVKFCPFLSQSLVKEGESVECMKEDCALWHHSQQCAFLATAVSADDTASILEEVKDMLEDIQLTVEDIAEDDCGDEDDQEVTYECPACAYVGTADEWNKKTAEMFEDEINSIEDNNERPECYYGCPNCGDEVDGANITIDVRPKGCQCGCED